MKTRITFLLASLFCIIYQSQAVEPLPDTVWTKWLYPKVTTNVRFFNNDSLIITSGQKPNPQIYNAQTGELVYTFPEFDRASEYLDVSKDEKYLYVSGGNSVAIWDLSKRAIIPTPILSQYKPISGGFSGDGNQLIGYNLDNTDSTWKIFIFETKNWNLVKKVSFEGLATGSVLFSPTNDLIVLAERRDINSKEKSQIGLWNTKTFEYLGILGSHNSGINAICFSPDGRYLASADTIVKIWDLEQKKLLKQFVFPAVKAITFSNDNNYLIVSGGEWNEWHSNIYYLLDLKINYSYPYQSGCIDVSHNNKYISLTHGTTLIMLNAKWESTSIIENQNQKLDIIVYPNPTNGIAAIDFYLSNDGIVKITISDLLSNEIIKFPEKFYNSGHQQIECNTSNYPNGTYLCKFESNGIQSTIKIIVNK
ncbi:MAG: Serine/threonine protein kinase-related protein [Ignavibacteria bacterium]|nr:Serine/threonine protein kinase-related protein [Ignavibacteria bacterium]